MIRRAAASLLLAAAACGGERRPAGEGAFDAVSGTDGPNAGQNLAYGNGAGWRLEISAAGASLTAPADARGAVELRIACVLHPAMMTVATEATATIGSEERFTLGVDGELYVFVAAAENPPPVGVHAERPIEAEVLRALEGAREIHAVYGATSLGPFPAPQAVDRTSFTTACRQIARE